MRIDREVRGREYVQARQCTIVAMGADSCCMTPIIEARLPSKHGSGERTLSQWLFHAKHSYMKPQLCSPLPQNDLPPVTVPRRVVINELDCQNACTEKGLVCIHPLQITTRPSGGPLLLSRPLKHNSATHIVSKRYKSKRRMCHE